MAQRNDVRRTGEKAKLLRESITSTNDIFCKIAKRVMLEIAMRGQKFNNDKVIVNWIIDYINDDYLKGEAPHSRCVDLVIEAIQVLQLHSMVNTVCKENENSNINSLESQINLNDLNNNNSNNSNMDNTGNNRNNNINVLNTENNNINKNNNGNIINGNANIVGKKRKRKYDNNNTTFLNQPKASDNDDEPAKKKRKFTRSDITPKNKHKVITWMRDHPNKPARQVKEKFPIILRHTSERAIQKWRKMTDEKYHNLLKSNKKRERKSIPKFPTIEKEMLQKREKRVQQGRDRSVKWFVKETKKLLADDEKLAELDLTEFEKENLDKFHASIGWVNKVVDRNDLKKKAKQSDRKMTMEEYIALRPEYLKRERDIRTK